MPVVGMGGFFFRAKDPQALKAWYRKHLGIGGGCLAGATPTSESAGPQLSEHFWHTQAGPMVFEPFAHTTNYFPRDRQAMIDLRVSDLDGLLQQLRAAGIETVAGHDSESEFGRFARIHDPEGNPIELWEPAAP